MVSSTHQNTQLILKMKQNCKSTTHVEMTKLDQDQEMSLFIQHEQRYETAIILKFLFTDSCVAGTFRDRTIQCVLSSVIQNIVQDLMQYHTKTTLLCCSDTGLASKMAGKSCPNSPYTQSSNSTGRRLLRCSWSFEVTN